MLLLTYKQIRASERSRNAYFHAAKNLIFLYGLLQLPLLLLLTLFTSYTGSIKYILYIRFQKYCLIYAQVTEPHKKLQYFNGEFHSLVIGDFCERIIPPSDLQVPFTYIIGSPAILYL